MTLERLMPHDTLGWLGAGEEFADSPPRPPQLSDDEDEEEGLTPLLSGAEVGGPGGNPQGAGSRTLII